MEFPLSPQQAFNVAYNGVVGQGRASLINGECKYEDREEGLHCAAGHVFKQTNPDFSLDHHETRGSSSHSLLMNLGYFDTLSDAEQSRVGSVLRDSQVAHDNAGHMAACGKVEFVPEFKRRMGLVAAERGLQIPKED